MRIGSAVVLAVLLGASTAAARHPKGPDSLLDRVREIHRQVVAAYALAETPMDEKARRSLLQRLERLDTQLSELELSVRDGSLAPAPVVAAPPPPPPPPAPPARPPLRDAEAKDLVRQLGESSFAADRKAVLEAALDHRSLSTAQARRLLDLFPFAEERVEAAAFIVPRLSDPDSAHTLLDAMQFAGDKEKLREIIRAAREHK